MGVHDYTCSLCGAPASYECREDSFGECEQDGIGNDEAQLDLLFFAEADAPGSPAEVDAARGRARRIERRATQYDWGAWDFQPALNYRGILFDDRDQHGIWRIDPDAGDRDPVELEIPPGETVWVVNHCPDCWRAFVSPADAPPEQLCVKYLQAVAEQLRIPYGPEVSKAQLVETVRAQVKVRAPAQG